MTEIPVDTPGAVLPDFPATIPPTQTREPTATVSPTPTIKATPTSQAPINALTLPNPQDYSWQLVVTGLERPVGFVDARDSTGRYFIVEQPGVVRIFQGGTILSQPFLDIRGRVGDQGNEQGLLGLAFHPRYSENGMFYVNYTNVEGDTIIAQFTVLQDDPNRAIADSEKLLLYIPQPYGNHNGGSVVFGPDGYLYLGLGDGGSAGDPQGNAQSLMNSLGKILRIDVDSGEPYSIPPDNPFAQDANPGGRLAEIWAYGLRNPWRFSFDSATGDIFIADVGQNNWEEINYFPAGAPPGANFGWDYREGMHSYEGNPPAVVSVIDPVAEYDHSQGCSVTGGYVYRGESLPAWQGIYIFGDYCSGSVWGLLQQPDGSWMQGLLFNTDFNISSFNEDTAGEIYLVDLSGGVYRLTENP